MLSWSHRALTADQAAAFALLSTAPGPDIGLPAASCLTGLSPNDTRTLLRGLEQASLIVQDAPGRYRMHDLVRARAAALAPDLPGEVRWAATRRLLDFYTRTAHEADRLLHPHRPPVRPGTPEPGVRPHPLPDAPAALAWFDAEHANLLAAQNASATGGHHQAVWRIAWTLSSFHTRRGHLHDDLAVWQTALESAGHLPDAAVRCVIHQHLGVAHADLGHHAEAAEHLHRALDLAERDHDVVHQGHIRFHLAWASERRGDFREALEHSRRVLDLATGHDAHPVWRADALNQVGWHTARLGDHDAARAHCHAALALHRRHGNAGGEAHALANLGYVDHLTGEHERAVDRCRRAAGLLRRAGDAYHGAGVRDLEGRACAALGRHAEACAAWREAGELYREQGRHDDAERVRRQLEGLGTSSTVVG
ncbi:tetratricopeptide repeat protein [Actinosynnema sp. NPDC091369]